MFFPILVIIVGVVWLLKNLDLISTDIWSIVLPVAVILAGVSLLTKKHGHWSKSKNQREQP